MLITLILLAAALMISNIPFDKIPRFTLDNDRENRIKILLVVAVIATIVIFPQETFFPITFMYIMSGPVRALKRLLDVRKQDEDQPLAVKEDKE